MIVVINFKVLYHPASPRLKAKIDAREQQVAKAEQEAATPTKDDNPSSADKVRHAVRKTVVTKRVVDLFFKNMSENDEKTEKL